MHAVPVGMINKRLRKYLSQLLIHLAWADEDYLWLKLVQAAQQENSHTHRLHSNIQYMLPGLQVLCTIFTRIELGKG